MKKVFVVPALILFSVLAGSSRAQILLKPDKAASFDRSKSIIVLYSSVKGSFFLDGHLMTDLQGSDTVFIINVPCGEHTAKLVSGEKSLSEEFHLGYRKAVAINAGNDLLNVEKKPLPYEDVVATVKGQRVFFLNDLSFFNITQAALLTCYIEDAPNGDGDRWFNTFTMINGFQVSPGFCFGIGLSYNNYDVIVTHMSQPMQNVPFLPVFLDIRTHLPGRRVAPFIKFDIGYNLLLSEKSVSESYTDYDQSLITKTSTMTGGGVYLSPGLGFRIGLTKLVQVIVSGDFVYQTSTWKLSTSGYPYPYYDQIGKVGMMDFRLNIGIGFQK